MSTCSECGDWARPPRGCAGPHHSLCTKYDPGEEIRVLLRRMVSQDVRSSRLNTSDLILSALRELEERPRGGKE